jgi:branched-chain amino acid aminotransferase
MKNIIFLNGKFMDKDEGCVKVGDPGFLYGWGAFETMRFRDGNTVYLNEHINRLHGSCRLLNIDLLYTAEKLKVAICQTVKRNGLDDARVRLSVWKKESGCGVLATAEHYQAFSKAAYSSGLNICLSGLKQDESSILARIKTMNRLLYELSFEQARIDGCDDAIILNSRGYIAECSRANIFLVKDKELFTPSVRCGCLNGVTRMAVLDLAGENGINASEVNLTMKDLEDADEVLLTNSLFGIMPVRSINGAKAGRSLKRPITRVLSDNYLRLWNSQK